jgi:hypothetical protein
MLLIRLSHLDILVNMLIGNMSSNKEACEGCHCELARRKIGFA